MSAQGPLVFGFLGLGLRGFGPGLDNLTITQVQCLIMDHIEEQALSESATWFLQEV